MFTHADLTTAARAWWTAGFSPLPIRTDGTKSPALSSWTQYQDERPPAATVKSWFDGSTDGIGIVTGGPGGLEMFEFEGRAADKIDAFVAAVAQAGLGDVWAAMADGYLERSPSGGIHVLYRVDGPPQRSRKLASRPADPEEFEADRARWWAENVEGARTDDARAKAVERFEKLTPAKFPKVEIETRGAHGFVVVAPSFGRTHNTGRPYEILRGGVDQLATITPEQREEIHAVARSFDTMPARELQQPKTPSPTGVVEGDRPGDEFNARTSWDDILGPAGWTKLRRVGDGWQWTRPGKSPADGPSATTNTDANGSDRLFVFSTSTEFPPEEPVSKFYAHAILNHGGDMKAAARDLGRQGFGTDDVVRVVDEPTGGAFEGTPFELHARRAEAAAFDRMAQQYDQDTAPGPQPSPTVVDTIEITETDARTDDGNALQLVNRFGRIIRYNADQGRWLSWDGSKWNVEPSGGGIVREHVKQIGRAMEALDKDEAKWRRHTLSARGVSDTLRQAATDHRVVVTTDDLDARPYELNTPAGIIDLTTGQLIPADPARLHTRTAAVAPDPTMPAPLWTRFLETTFPDPEIRAYVQRLIGYMSTGVVKDHILPFAFGEGGNGKSVLTNTVQTVLGDYAQSSPGGFLMASNYSGHTTEIARLAGSRFVVCSEVNDGDRFDEAKVKMLTGGDMLTARFMRQDDFTFRPTHHLWLMGNFKPSVESGGHGFWRRLRLIPFTNTVSETDRIDDLEQRLEAEEAPAVLAWIAEGARQYHEGGLREPASVKAATQDYAHDVDTVGRFIEDECTIHATDAITADVSDVRAAYLSWCKSNGEEPVTGRSFATMLARHGVLTGRAAPKAPGGRRMYGRISLRARDEAPSWHDRDDEHDGEPTGGLFT